MASPAAAKMSDVKASARRWASAAASFTMNRPDEVTAGSVRLRYCFFTSAAASAAASPRLAVLPELSASAADSPPSPSPARASAVKQRR